MRTCLAVLCVLLTVFALGCAQKEEKVAEKQPAPEAPKVLTAADLWKMISQDEPYTQYAFWPGVEGIMPGQSPHGAFIRTYVNEKALAAQPPAYAYGSVIVKENFMPDTTLAKLTVMYKVEDYNAEAGDWFWAIFGADGTVEGEGKVQGCISCHAARKDNDYVFLHTLVESE